MTSKIECFVQNFGDERQKKKSPIHRVLTEPPALHPTYHYYNLPRQLLLITKCPFSSLLFLPLLPLLLCASLAAISNPLFPTLQFS